MKSERISRRTLCTSGLLFAHCRTAARGTRLRPSGLVYPSAANRTRSILQS
jgi:hypothetical protein